LKNRVNRNPEEYGTAILAMQKLPFKKNEDPDGPRRQ
jgi:hypothetical protein